MQATGLIVRGLAGNETGRGQLGVDGWQGATNRLSQGRGGGLIPDDAPSSQRIETLSSFQQTCYFHMLRIYHCHSRSGMHDSQLHQLRPHRSGNKNHLTHPPHHGAATLHPQARHVMTPKRGEGAVCASTILIRSILTSLSVLGSIPFSPSIVCTPGSIQPGPPYSLPRWSTPPTSGIGTDPFDDGRTRSQLARHGAVRCRRGE